MSVCPFLVMFRLHGFGRVIFCFFFCFGYLWLHIGQANKRSLPVFPMKWMGPLCSLLFLFTDLRFLFLFSAIRDSVFNVCKSTPNHVSRDSTVSMFLFLLFCFVSLATHKTARKETIGDNYYCFLVERNWNNAQRSNNLSVEANAIHLQNDLFWAKIADAIAVWLLVVSRTSSDLQVPLVIKSVFVLCCGLRIASTAYRMQRQMHTHTNASTNLSQ